MSMHKEGYLLKENKELGFWNKKYFVMQYNMLLQFDKEPSSTKRGQPDRTYNLTNASVRNAEGLHRCGFVVELPTGKKPGEFKKVHLAADNVNELKDWMDTIKESAKPVEVTRKESEKKLPGRWDPPANNNNNKNNKGGGGGGVKEKPATQTTTVSTPPEQQVVSAPPQQAPAQQVPQQPQYSPQQPQYTPPQQYAPQYNQPQYNQPQYNPQYGQPQYGPPQGYYQPQYSPQQQYYQPQHQQYQQPPQYQQQPPQYQSPPPQQPGKYQDLYGAPKAPANEPMSFPTVPTEQPSTGTMFPNLKQLGQ